MSRPEAGLFDADELSVLEGMNGCSEIHVADAGLLKYLDKSEAEFFLELADVLISDLD